MTDGNKRELGKIIARPRSDGGYRLYRYNGIQIGWTRCGAVDHGQDVQEAMQNLARPVETLNQLEGTKT